MIDKEVKELLDKAFEMATNILKEHRGGLTALAELLLEKEVVFAEDVERIFGRREKDIEREAEEAAAKSAEAEQSNNEESAPAEQSEEPVYTITEE